MGYTNIPSPVTNNLYVTSSSVTDTTSILAAVTGVRYRIHSIGITVATLVADANTLYGIQFTVGGSPMKYQLLKTTLVAGNSISIFETPDILCDVTTAITVALSGALTAGNIRIAYSIVR